MALTEDEWSRVLRVAEKVLPLKPSSGPTGLDWYQSREKRDLDRRRAGRLSFLAAIPGRFVQSWAASDGFSPIYRIEVRLNGLPNPLVMEKFRTMSPDADGLLDRLVGADETVTEWKSRDDRGRDPRIRGRIALLVRQFRADDIPQLARIARGLGFLFAPRLAVPKDVKVIQSLAEQGNDDAGMYIEFLRATGMPGAVGFVDLFVGHRADLGQRLFLNALEIRRASRDYDKRLEFNLIWAVLRGGGK